MKIGEEESIYFAFMTGEISIDDEPASYTEAIQSRESKEWRKSIDDEFDSLKKCETWDVIPIKEMPKNSSIVTGKLIMKKKFEGDGSVRFKSRLVARGFQDTNDYCSYELYAPVARLSDVRIILSIANRYELELTQFDVKTAFLNGKLERPVFMRIPEGLYEWSKIRDCSEIEYKRDNVCKLNRSIYGLKVSPKCWYRLFDRAMNKIRFTKYPFHPCLYSWRSGEKFALLLLYVDDILLTSNCSLKMKEVEEMLNREFEVNNLGSPRKFLGIEIERIKSKRQIKIHQKHFVNKILRKFNFAGEPNEKHVTPMNANYESELMKRPSETVLAKVKEFPYRQIIGALLYLQGGTRPDIAYAVNILSRRQSDFGEQDIRDVKRVLRYLRNTENLGIVFESKGNETLTCYPDASLGFNDKKSQSTSGYAIFVNGDLVAWRTKKQNHVALSSAEAEYIAMSLCCKEIICIQEMLRRLLRIRVTGKLYEDNRAAIEIAQTEESNTLKHIVKLCYHYVKDQCRRRNVKIDWISTTEQIGDFFTKPLSKLKFIEFRERLLTRM